MNRGVALRFVFIIILVALGICEILIKDSPSIQKSDPGDNMLGMQLGLDLSGGVNLIYEADLTAIGNVSSSDAMKGAIRIIESRVNAYGVSEPVIQKLGSDRISIQLPGIRKMEEAIDLIGSTAELSFRELTDSSWSQFSSGVDPYTLEWIPATGTLGDKTVALTGRYLKSNTYVTFDQIGNPEVAFALTSDGATLFSQITGRLYTGQRPLGIFLDNKLISYPRVQVVISDNGVITGLTRDGAKKLSILLNAGALPVPLGHWEGKKFVSGPAVQEKVDPSLGSDSLRKSLIAGFAGIFIIMLFMILYYRLPGALAAGALIVYAIIILAVFKLIPVTLTLSGIAAFILSLGMAVDANVLIFERFKEELREGRTVFAAIEAGFTRAWSSIWDSNITTLIACGILYWMGHTFGEMSVTGFALTLAIGVITSLFTAIFVTKTFLRLATMTRAVDNTWLFGYKQTEQKPTSFEEQ